MSVTSCKVACLVALAALSLGTGNVVAKPPSGPQIAASSCGGSPVPPSGNAFCSFEGTGDGVEIAQNSCNVIGACLVLGNGVRIGHDSCNGDSACTATGTLFGEAVSAVSVIGNRSCNGLDACAYAGAEGFSVIGNDSCNGGEAACFGGGQLGGARYIGNNACNNLAIGASHNTCLFIGDLGYAVIGNGSCNGSSACTFTGQFGATSVIGVNSCNGLGACFDAGQGPFPGTGDFQSASAIGNGSCNAEAACQFVGIAGSSSIGNTSCNNLFACEFAGSFNAGSTVGNHSCNGAPDLSDPDLPVGVCDSNEGVIGNNKRNSP